MVNSVYKFDRRVVYDYDVTDYTSVYYGQLRELFKQYPDFFMIYKADVDDKVENISYDLYGSEDYADVILASNGSVHLWGMAYNNDVVLEQVSSLEKIIRKELDITEDSPEYLMEVFYSIEEKVNKLNSAKRDLTVPKPSKLNIILSIIDRYREDNKVLDITDYSSED